MLYSRFSLVTYFVHGINNVCMSIPISQFIPPSTSPIGILNCFLYIYVSISALQLRYMTFVFLFLTFTLYDNLWFLFRACKSFAFSHVFIFSLILSNLSKYSWLCRYFLFRSALQSENVVLSMTYYYVK